MLVGVNRVITPIYESYFEIDERIPCDGSRGGGLENPFFDRGPEVLRNGAAKDLVDPFKSGPAVERFKDHLAVPELAAAARLFLVPPLNLGRLRDGLFIRDLRRMQCDLNVIAVL